MTGIMRLERILVPVDFSAHAEQASLVAADIAARFAAEVRLLHIDPFPGAAAVAIEPVYIPPDLFAGLHADYNRRIDSSMDEVEQLINTAKSADVGVSKDRRTGAPVDGIIEYARDWHADLIVMGSSGLSGAARYLLGSIADKVSRNAPCPVLITRARDDDARPKRPFHRVLAAVDFSAFSVPVTRVSDALCVPHGIVEIVHVWSPPYLSALNFGLGGDEPHPTVDQLIERGRASEAKRLEAFVAERDISRATAYIASGNVPDALLERVDEIQADVLVLGAHGSRNFSERIIGTVADRVLRHATTSVLLVPPEAAEQWF